MQCPLASEIWLGTQYPKHKIHTVELLNTSDLWIYKNTLVITNSFEPFSELPGSSIDPWIGKSTAGFSGLTYLGIHKRIGTTT
jgi:hypothetical protein